MTTPVNGDGRGLAARSRPPSDVDWPSRRTPRSRCGRRVVVGDDPDVDVVALARRGAAVGAHDDVARLARRGRRRGRRRRRRRRAPRRRRPRRPGPRPRRRRARSSGRNAEVTVVAPRCRRVRPRGSSGISRRCRSATPPSATGGVEQVHRGGADEAGDEDVGRAVVQVARGADLLQEAVLEDARRGRPWSWPRSGRA